MASCIYERYETQFGELKSNTCGNHLSEKLRFSPHDQDNALHSVRHRFSASHLSRCLGNCQTLHAATGVCESNNRVGETSVLASVKAFLTTHTWDVRTAELNNYCFSGTTSCKRRTRYKTDLPLSEEETLLVFYSCGHLAGRWLNINVNVNTLIVFVLLVHVMYLSCAEQIILHYDMVTSRVSVNC